MVFLGYSSKQKPMTSALYGEKHCHECLNYSLPHTRPVTARRTSYSALRCSNHPPPCHTLQGGQGETAPVPQEGVIAFIRSQPGGAAGHVLVLDAKDSIERYF